MVCVRGLFDVVVNGLKGQEAAGGDCAHPIGLSLWERHTSGRKMTVLCSGAPWFLAQETT